MRIVFPFFPDGYLNNDLRNDLLVLRHKIGICNHRGFDIFMNYKTAEIFEDYKEFTDGGDFTFSEFAGRMKYKIEKWKPDSIIELFVVKVV